MFIIFDLNGEVLTICSSERSLFLATKNMEKGTYTVSKWDCPSEISTYLSRT